MPPVVRNEVIEKFIAFCTSLKSSLAASGPPKQSTYSRSSSAFKVSKYCLGMTQSLSKKMKYSPLARSMP